MKFHAHITINTQVDIPQVPKGWKQTHILLERDNREQLDIMLTKHYKIGYRNIQSIQDIHKDIKLTTNEFFNKDEILRVKIEQDQGFFLPISNENYVEIHMLFKDHLSLDNSWVISRNLKKQKEGKDCLFLNKRIRSGSYVNEIKTSLRTQLKDIEPKEFHIEQIVFDSNPNHDRWWA